MYCRFYLFLKFQFLSVAVAADEANVVYIGTAVNSPPSEVSTAIFNFVEAKDSRVRTFVTAIGLERNASGVSVKKANIAILSPEKYRISFYCIYNSRDILMQERYAFKPGRKYSIRCDGKTPRTVKLLIEDIGSNAKA